MTKMERCTCPQSCPIFPGTEVERKEIIGMMFPEMHESAMWKIQFDEKYIGSVFDYLVFMRVQLFRGALRDDNDVVLAANVNWESFGRAYRWFRD